jgi:hypothetical protein
MDPIVIAYPLRFFLSSTSNKGLFRVAIPSAGLSTRAGVSGIPLLERSHYESSFMYAVKVYATGTTTADSVASFIVPLSGKLVLITGAILIAGTVLPTSKLQFASQSTSQWALNDSRNIITECCLAADSTSQIASTNIGLPIPGLSLKAGDKVYLHRQVSGTISSCVCDFNLWFV